MKLRGRAAQAQRSVASRMFLKFLTIAALLFASLIVARGNCPNVRKLDFRNHTYPLHERGFTQGLEWLRVTNGRYEDHKIPTSVSFLYFQIVNVAFGDLDGDGKDEAAATAIYGSNSGSFYLTDTYVFGCVAGRIKLVGILKQDDIEKATGMDLQESVNNPMTIKNGVLKITHGTEGNRPSPEFTTTFRYRIRRGKFVLAGWPLRRQNY